MLSMSTSKRMTLVGAAAALALSACGGGGGSGSTTPPPPSSDLTLQGAAATGLAIAGGAVEATCAAGTGTATTQASGNYALTITGGAPPCVLKVTPTGGGTVLHSAIGGSGAGTVTANITPLTELIVANATGGAPEALFTPFDAAAQAKVATARLDAATQAVTAALQGRVDLAGLNPITGTLVPATAANPTGGNALDQKLDALQAALAAAQTTLAELTTAVAASGNTSAPVQTLLQPAATGCAGFRSGRYVALNPAETDPQWAAHTFSLNAATLTATFFDQSTLTLSDQGGCKYTAAEVGATTQYLVSKSGVTIGLRTYTTGTFAGMTDASLVIPAQALPLSELAGTWNALRYARVSSNQSFTPTRLTLGIDAAGQVTSGSECSTSGTCNAFGSGAAFSVDNAGGFDFSQGAGQAVSRAFAFKTSDGHLTLFILQPNQLGMIVATKQVALTLPAVSPVATPFWDLAVEANGFVFTTNFVPAVTNATTTVTAVDATAGTYTRINQASRVDTLKLNDPVPGMRSRPANSCTINGQANNCVGTVQMPLSGAGVTVYVGVAPANFFGISVLKP
jgi:hypothetical protein